MISDSREQQDTLHDPASLPRRARGVIDISHIALADVPPAIEERLRKSKGIITVQVNAFSKKLAIEFDPSLITLDEIVNKITRPA